MQTQEEDTPSWRVRKFATKVGDWSCRRRLESALITITLRRSLRGSEDERHRHFLQRQPNGEPDWPVMSDLNTPVLQLHRHHHFHAHIPYDLWYPVLSWSDSQRTGHLRGQSLQEENGFGYLRVESGNSGHAVFACDAFQHSSAGERQTMGLWKLYV